MKIKFYLSRKGKLERLVYLVIHYNSNTIQISTGLRILPQYWDAKKQEASVTYPLAGQFNAVLSKKKSDVYQSYLHIVNENTDQDAIYDELIKLYKKANAVHNKTFFEHFESYYKALEIVDSTLKGYGNAVSDLREFKPDLTFKDITLIFLEDFQDYLTKRGVTNGTINQRLTKIKAFLRYALDRNLTTNSEFQRLKHKKYLPKENIVLSESDLDLIKTFHSEDAKLMIYRDSFLLQCLTGLRFSDLKNFNKVNIRENVLYFRTQKTNDLLSIPLHQYAIDILKKYDMNLPELDYNKSLYAIRKIAYQCGLSKQYEINIYIGKERTRKVKYQYELIGTHTARRTFITLMLEKGMRPETLMKITGHKDIETLMKYVKINDKIKTMEFNRAIEKLVSNN